jgi:hypothetical protein
MQMPLFAWAWEPSEELVRPWYPGPTFSSTAGLASWSVILQIKISDLVHENKSVASSQM